MNQKPEDRLSEWFRTAPLPDEPASLHEFLASVPRDHARPMPGSRSIASLWPRRVLAGLAAGLVVVVIGGGLLFGLVSREQTVPGGSPSASATATAKASGSVPAPTGSTGPTTSAPNATPSPTDAASPTPNTAWKAGLPTLNLPATAIKTAGVSLPEPDSVSTQVWGSRYYLVDWTAVDDGLAPTSSATAIIRYGDIATGKAASVPLLLTSAELAGIKSPRVGGGFSVAADGSHVAVVVWYRLQSGSLAIPCPSNYDTPISWRILVAPLDPSTGAPGTFAAIASGHSKIAFRPTTIGEGCDTVSAPDIALSGDLIAYNIEAATAGHPLAGTILLHSLSGGSPDRQIQTDAMPMGLRVSDTNVTWLESDGNPVVPLRLSTASHPAPVLVEAMDATNSDGNWRMPRFSLDGDRIAWEEPATGEVLMETIGGSATRISPTGVACLLGGSEAGNVLLMCYPGDPFWGNSDLVIWSSTAGPQLVAGYPAGADGASWLSNGWVATEASGYPSSGVTFFRLSDLVG
jgi:hypothetical protein